MISVILPVLNEEKTIGKIVRKLKGKPDIGEIIVVDDKSFDDTVGEASRAGATVITSTKIGKGASMRDGLLVSKGDIVVYLDGDIEEYPVDTVEKLTRSIVEDKTDFVKGAFEREQGMVTKLATVPLLNIFFPELLSFSQPLSGMIAGKKVFFEKIKFEDDYGVDIGILIDMHKLGIRMQEVNIGHIQNKKKLWNKSYMASDVARAILNRADFFPSPNLEQLQVISVVRSQMEFAMKKTFMKGKKLVIFDMDNTILDGGFIEKAAVQFGFQKELAEIRAKHRDHLVITKHIALLLKGKNIAQILEIVEQVPLVSDIIPVIAQLKKRGYIVGIITHSYDCVATHVKNKIGADFALSFELEFSDSIATGEVQVPSFFIHNDASQCAHEMCKTNALLSVARQYGINCHNIIAVGDGEQDVCMIQYAGIGVSFRSKHQALNYIADKVITNKSFKPLLAFAR